MTHDKKKQLFFSFDVFLTFWTNNETGEKLWTQNFPISSFQKSLSYKCLLDAGIHRKPFDKM